MRELRVKIDNGGGPQNEKDARKRKKEVKKFSELAQEYKEKEIPKLRENTQKEYIRIVDNELLPKLGDYHIDEIDKLLINEILDDKAYGTKDSDPAPRMANSLRTRLSRIFNFGIEEDLVKHNPVQLTTNYSEGENKRDRFYSDKEIRELWNYFEDWEAPRPQFLKCFLLPVSAKRKLCLCVGIRLIVMFGLFQERLQRVDGLMMFHFLNSPKK